MKFLLYQLLFQICALFETLKKVSELMSLYGPIYTEDKLYNHRQ